MTIPELRKRMRQTVINGYSGSSETRKKIVTIMQNLGEKIHHPDQVVEWIKGNEIIVYCPFCEGWIMSPAGAKGPGISQKEFIETFNYELRRTESGR